VDSLDRRAHDTKRTVKGKKRVAPPLGWVALGRRWLHLESKENASKKAGRVQLKESGRPIINHQLDTNGLG